MIRERKETPFLNTLAFTLGASRRCVDCAWRADGKGKDKSDFWGVTPIFQPASSVAAESCSWSWSCRGATWFDEAEAEAEAEAEPAGRRT